VRWVFALNNEESTPGEVLAWKCDWKFVLFTGWFWFVSMLQGVGLRFCCWTSCDGWLRSPRLPLFGRQRKSVHPRIFGKSRLWFQQTLLRNPFRIERTAPAAHFRGSSSALSNCKPQRISFHKVHNGGAYCRCVLRDGSWDSSACWSLASKFDI